MLCCRVPSIINCLYTLDTNNTWLHVLVTYFKRAFAPDDPVNTVRKELDESVTQVLELVQSLAFVESGKHHKGSVSSCISSMQLE